MKKLVAVAVAGFASVGLATDYAFKGTVDACLDKAGNWDPALETLTTSDTLNVKGSDTALKTLTLSADWSPNVKEWDVQSFTFDLGAGKTLTFPGTSEAFYITGGYHFNLTSGTLYSPNCPFTIGRWTPNVGFAEISGEGTLLKVKGVLLNGRNSWNGEDGFVVRDGATADLLGGELRIVEGPVKVHVCSATVTNLTQINIQNSNNQYWPWGGDYLFSNATFKTTSQFFNGADGAFSNNTIRVVGGSKVEVPQFNLRNGKCNRIELSGEGTEIYHTYNTFNGFARIGGQTNTFVISDGARFRTTGGSLYASFSFGYRDAYVKPPIGNELVITNGGRLVIENANVNLGESNGGTTPICRNAIRVTGEGSVAVAGGVLHIGGAYNNGSTVDYANVYSNVVEVADGGVFSNLNTTANTEVGLPRQGWGNLVRIDGGTFYSACNVGMGLGMKEMVATNNLVEVAGGGVFEMPGKTFSLRGGKNVLRVTDGMFTASSISCGDGASDARLEVGTNGVVQLTVLSFHAGSEVVEFDVPHEGYAQVPLQANIDITVPGARFRFKGIERCAPGKYVIAESTVGGYMKDIADMLEAANAELKDIRPGTKLIREGNNWTAGKTVKLCLKVSGGMMLLVR